jgi:hypothetical protein
MDSSQIKPIGRCPQCGAKPIPGQVKCWLCCGEQTPASTGGPAPVSSLPRVEYQPAPPTVSSQNNVASVLLIATLVAVLTSMTLMNPGIGIMVAFLTLPVLLRNCFTALRHGASVQPMSASNFIARFMLSLAMIVAVFVAAGAAFFFTCLGTWVVGGAARINPDEVIFLGLILGGIASCVAVIVFSWIFWKISHPRKNN